jgi:NAD(P)-dependent dehydrogenase (short-subunit alcohol dehydrogenase family)
MPNENPRTVLITGCSTGIGRALALEFHSRGFVVTATARRLEALSDMAGREGFITLRLDVTDQKSIEAAVADAVSRAGGIGVLVNNAGFGLMGPVAELPIEDFRKQLETNVVAPLAVARAVVPHMVRAGGGRIVNVGSVSGILTSPFSGAYCASKAALHSLSDAMRLELAPFGIKVLTLQPGGIISAFSDNAEAGLGDAGGRGSLYEPVAGMIKARARISQEGAMKADEFARSAVDAVLLDNPPAVFRMGVNSTKLPLFNWLLPKSVSDRVLSKKFGLNKLKKM